MGKHHKHINVANIVDNIGRKINHTVSPVIHTGLHETNKIIDKATGFAKDESQILKWPLIIGGVIVVGFYLSTRR